MASFLQELVPFSRPFKYTGMDFAGPFDLINYTERACPITKGYVLVFVCFSTKAIHLESTSDLTTEKFISAFAGYITIILYYSYQQLNWHFIPFGAPHMGGLWEVGVKSFKGKLRECLLFKSFQPS